MTLLSMNILCHGYGPVLGGLIAQLVTQRFQEHHL